MHASSRLTLSIHLLILFAFFLAFMSLALFIQYAWLGPSPSLVVPISMSIRWMQLITTIFSFFLPALCWPLLRRHESPSPLATSFPPSAVWLLYGLGIGLLMAMPNAFLTELNSLLPQPNWAANMDKKIQVAAYALLSVDTPQGFLVNTLVIAIAPAICEEFFFRGALQHSLLRLLPQPHLAIWIGAVIFSLIHFQLSGFLPRLVLGATLGYLAYYSKSIWPSIVMHFTNNLLAVSIYSIAFRNGNIEQFNHISPWISCPSALISIFLIVSFFIRLDKKETLTRISPLQ